MEHTTIAVDLAKSVCQVAIPHQVGRVDEERRLSRDRFLAFFAQQPPATVVFEACGSAHYWARQAPYGFDDLFSTVFRNPSFVDVARTFEPRDTVVVLGDDAVQT